MIERTIAFGANNGLIGTLCVPSPEVAGAGGVGHILFNAGVVHRIGPHRVNVRLARRLARRGIASIRFDLAGQGDSARADADLPFEEQAVLDLRSAMDALAAQSSARRFVIFGFCSGGWHGFRATPDEERVAGLILYDAYFFRTLRSRWIRYLTPIRRRGLLNAVIGRVRRLPDEIRQWASRWKEGGKARVPGLSLNHVSLSRKAFAERVRSLHRRGVKIGMMYSGDFEKDYNYREQFDDAFRRHGIRELVTYDYFPDTGHTLTALSSQDAFLERIEHWTVELDAGYCGRGAAGDRPDASS